MSAYLLVVGDEQTAWELSASAQVEYYETADGLDPLAVLTNVIESVEVSEARLLVTDDGPAAEELASKLATTLGWVAMATAVQIDDPNIIAISPDATPATIAAALDLVYAPRQRTLASVAEPVTEPAAAQEPEPHPVEQDRPQVRPDPPPGPATAVVAPAPPSDPDQATSSPILSSRQPESEHQAPPDLPAAERPSPHPPAGPERPSPVAEPPHSAAEHPSPGAVPTAPAASERPSPVAEPLPISQEDAPLRPPPYSPAAPARDPSAPPHQEPRPPQPRMPWQESQPPRTRDQDPQVERPIEPSAETVSPAAPPTDPVWPPGPPTDSEWRGPSTLDDPSYAAAPWAAQTSGPPNATRGQVIVVASGKGGVGKSTMSMWITEALTQLGHGAVLVDANVGQSDISKMGRVWKEAPGLGTLIGRKRLSAAEVLAACMPVPGLGPVLAAPRESALMDLDSALEALEQAIRALAAERPFVIVDGPVGSPLEPIYNRVLLRLADKMLMVMAAHEPTLHDCHNWLVSISKPVDEGGSNWDPTRTVAVVNRFTREDGMGEAEIAKSFEGLTMCSPIPWVEATMMVNRGRWRCPAEAAEAVMEVVRAVTGISATVNGASQQKSLLSRLFRRG
ncbi:MAG: P-loop NTPase [Gemmatimonadetes bacterium]|nr:P-loop NTPase [Gemmatimonadota bacterium]